MAENPSYYSIIPAIVRYDNTLKANEKLLYGEITSLANATGACWATNAYFAKLYGVSNIAVSNWIKSLTDHGYLSRKDIKSSDGKEQKRVLYITPLNKTLRGVKQNFNTPLKQNFKENNTRTNNKTNSSSSKQPQNSENAFEKYAGIGLNLSATQQAIFNGYFEDLGNDILCHAISYMDDHATHKNFSYLQQILRSYDQADVKSLEDVKKLEERRKTKNKQKKKQYNDFAGAHDDSLYKDVPF